MASQDLLLQTLRSFAAVMGRSYEITEMSYELCFRLTDVLGATGAGVSVTDSDGDLKFVTATDEVMVQIEEAQEKSQQGPCVAAFTSQQPVAISNLAEADKWPAYTTVAQQLGLNAVVGYPLSNNGHRLGALNLYNAEPREWSEDDLDVIGVFADMATAYLVRVSELAESRQLADQLQSALDSRVIIEQAKGILSGDHRISVDEAFERLRQHSQNNNLKLVEVCNAVVNMGLRLPEAPERRQR
jgi:GAF domain-containing protein